MKKFIIIAILLISNFSFYGAVNDKGEKINNIQEILNNDAVIENQVTEKEENIQEKIVSQETKEDEITEEKKDTEKQVEGTNDAVATQKNVQNNEQSKKTKESAKVNETKKEDIAPVTTQNIEKTTTTQANQNKETQAKKNQEIQKQEVTQEKETKKEEKILKCTNGKHQMPTGNSKRWFNTKDEAVKYYKSLQKLWSDKLINNEVDDDEYDANCPYGYQNWSCPECNMITLDFYFRK